MFLNHLNRPEDIIKRIQGDMVLGSPKVLVATSIGGYFPAATLESLLGIALKQRRAEAHVLLCDAVLPACMDCDVTWYPKQEQFVEHGPSKDLCVACFDPAAQIFEALGIVVHKYSEWISPEEREAARELSSSIPFEQIPEFVWEGISIGEHGLAGALRFFARATLGDEPHAEAVLRRFFHGALVTAYVGRNILVGNRFDCAVFHHGIYVPQGIIGEVARKYGVRVVNWNPAYRKNCFIFSHGSTYHHTMMDEPISVWEDLPWTSAMDEKLAAYLQSREQGTHDWIYFHERPIDELEQWIHENGLDPLKPCIGLLTNVMWDAQLHYPKNAFPNMLVWILQTIRYFSARPHLQLIIRVHPAERLGAIPSRQFAVEEIKKAFPDLPKNVFLIGPENRLSTYSVMKQCNGVLIYGTKMGVELCSIGIPVIVAGEAWIRNKGLTVDAGTREEYFQFLDKLPFSSKMTPEQTERARKYAYHFFFRRMIPLNCLTPIGHWPLYHVNISKLEDIQPGKDLGLDVICEGILSGTPFVFPEEQRKDPIPAGIMNKYSA
ncbi:MAG: capsule biosynthesis protein [Nitrospirales bacterium]